MEKKVSASSLKTGCMPTGGLVALPWNTPLTLCYQGKRYAIRTAAYSKGVIKNMQAFFRENKVKPGDQFSMSFDPKENCLYFEKMHSAAERMSILWGVKSPDLPPKPEPKEPFFSPVPVAENADAGWMLRALRAGVKSRNAEGTDEKADQSKPDPDCVLRAWREGENLWTVRQNRLGTRFCCQRTPDGPHEAVAVLSRDGQWDEKVWGLFLLADETMLLETNCCLRFFSQEGLVEEIPFTQMKNRGSLYAIEPKGKNRRDWLYVWGRTPNEMTCFWWNGARVRADTLETCPYVESMKAAVRREIWRTQPVCLPEVEKHIHYTYDAGKRLFEVCFWFRKSWAIRADAPRLERTVRTMKRRRFYITPDWSTMLLQDGKTVWTGKGVDPAKEERPDFVQEIANVLYGVEAVRAYNAQQPSQRPKMSDVRSRILAWYPDVSAAAVWMRPLPSDDEPWVYYVDVVFDERYADCAMLRYADTLEELAKSVMYLRVPPRYTCFIQTEEFLNSGDGCLQLLADVLTIQRRVNRFQSGDLHPESYEVTVSELADLVYGTDYWERGVCAVFYIDLHSFGYGSQEMICTDLRDHKVRFERRPEKEFWQDAIPGPETVAGFVPHLPQDIPLSREAPKPGAVPAFFRPCNPCRREDDPLKICCAIPEGAKPMDWDPNQHISLGLQLYWGRRGGWVPHPQFRDLDAYVLLEQGILYAKEGGLFFTDLERQTTRLADTGPVLAMELVGETLRLQVASGVSAPSLVRNHGEQELVWKIRDSRVEMPLPKR